MSFYKPSPSPDQPQQETMVTNQKALVIANLGKIFGVMFLGILLTAIGAVLWGLLLSHTNNLGLMIAGFVIGLIVMVVSSSVINWRAFKEGEKKLSLIAPYIVYALSLSFIFGAIGLIAGAEIIGISFGVTLLVFGILALFGIIFKNVNLNPVIYVIGAASIGVIVLILINLFLPPSAKFDSSIMWIISFVIFGIIMLTTIVDMWRINKIASTMPPNLNMTMYFAFRLYTDFANILLRVIYYMIIIGARSKK